MLHVMTPDEERKLPKFFVFTLVCSASKGFMKALKCKKWKGLRVTNSNHYIRV